MDGQRWGTLPGSAEQGWPRCLGSAAFLFQDLLFLSGHWILALSWGVENRQGIARMRVGCCLLGSIRGVSVGVVERGHVMIIGMRCFCVDVGIFFSVSVLRNFCKFVDCVILWNASLHRCDGLCVGRFCALKAGRTKHSKKR